MKMQDSIAQSCYSSCYNRSPRVSEDGSPECPVRPGPGRIRRRTLASKEFDDGFFAGRIVAFMAFADFTDFRHRSL